MAGQIVFAGVMPNGVDLLPADGAVPAETPPARACQVLAEAVVASRPDVIIWIDPHALTTRAAMGLYAGPVLRGDLAAFGRPSTTLELGTDLQLSQLLLGLSAEAAIPLLIQDRYIRQPLSHGVMVPWQFLRAAGLPDVPVAVVMPGGQSPASHAEFGQVIGYAAQRSGRRVAVIASAELAHGHEAAPGAAAAFDRSVTDAFAAGDWAALLTMSPASAEAVQDGGLAALVTLAGVFRPGATRPQVHHYEVVSGIGRLVAELHVTSHPEPEPDRRPVRDVASLADLAMEAIYCHSAKQEVIRAGGALSATCGDRQAGVFVTLYKEGKLRCCLGTVFPLQDTLCDEVIRTALAVAFQDPQHPPVTRAELPFLTVSVQIVHPPEPVHRMEGIDPARAGLIAYTGYRLGVLLPGADGIADAQTQVAQVMAKAGVAEGEPMWLLRFTVDTVNSWDPRPLTALHGEA